MKYSPPKGLLRLRYDRGTLTASQFCRKQAKLRRRSILGSSASACCFDCEPRALSRTPWRFRWSHLARYPIEIFKMIVLNDI
ncbi:hypothetical protein CDAR_555021 [Caerostris darwini]|uniref:Uncharacterized protein n=1 Tax=Caerostris darwini TaxID=1538125 RepID=A0AAV4RH32_9ARAC|nr:hypothetical protein CDAR_555021 [Caerostris darwini]